VIATAIEIARFAFTEESDVESPPVVGFSRGAALNEKEPLDTFLY